LWFDAEGPWLYHVTDWDDRREYKTVSVYKGLFKAPKTGNYKFFVSGDDYVKFKIDTTPFATAKTTYTPVMVAEVQKPTPYQDIFHHGS
jgi:hypothetical protein